ncbi:hypothetical protein RB213_007449 [Colletotrichum asianum]
MMLSFSLPSLVRNQESVSSRFQVGTCGRPKAKLLNTTANSQTATFHYQLCLPPSELGKLAA